MMDAERAACGPLFPLSAERRLGPKTPAGTNGEGASAVSRAQSGARTAPAQDARPPAHGRAGDTRGKGFRRRPVAGMEPNRKEGPVPKIDRRRDKAECPEPLPETLPNTHIWCGRASDAPDDRVAGGLCPLFVVPAKAGTHP